MWCKLFVSVVGCNKLKPQKKKLNYFSTFTMCFLPNEYFYALPSTCIVRLKNPDEFPFSLFWPKETCKLSLFDATRDISINYA